MARPRRNIEEMTVGDRAEQTRRARRKKPGSTIATGLNLYIPEEKLDRGTYVYRWVNDAGNRIQQMTDNDWDIDKSCLTGEALGSATEKSVGSDKDGKPIRGVVMRKFKDWYEEDQKEKQTPLDEMDKAIRGGTNHQSVAGELGESAYTPGGSNTLDHKSYGRK